jgi:hypothetical protein
MKLDRGAVKLVVALGLSLAAGSALAQSVEIQRALIQRDQQSAEFAARVRGADTSRLEQLHSQQLLDATVRPLSPDPEVARQLQPYQRQQMADERTLALTPPSVKAEPKAEKPAPRLLPLPRRDERLIDPIPAQDPRH